MDKLIYILNQYSHKDSSHFNHIFNLLETLSKDVKILLIIEKSQEYPNIKSDNIEVILQKEKGILRSIELYKILKQSYKIGYKRVFIRISQIAAIPAILLSKTCSLKVYYWHSGKTYHLDNEKPWCLEKIKWYFKSRIPFEFVKSNVDYFVTGPESMLDYYENIVHVKKDKLLCLYNDIDILRFSNVDDSKKEKLKNDLAITKKVILFVHKLSPVRKTNYYMPYILKKTLESFPNYICLVIGSGKEKSHLLENIKLLNLEDRVLLLDEVPNSMIHEYYNISDIFINPTYTEGFPRVLLESMASGVPFVTTNAGGIPDIISEKQKEFMVDIEDKESFSEKLYYLASNEKLQKELGMENIEYVQRFSTENIAKMYIDKIF